MIKNEPEKHTKYLAVWKANPILGEWMEQLPEITTLHTMREQLDHVAGDWLLCSTSKESRELDSGASSCVPAIRTMLNDSALFKSLHESILRHYGGPVLPEDVDRYLAKLAEDLNKLIDLYGEGVQILQVQKLGTFPK